MMSSPPVRRGYDASGRRRQALANRERILQAARELFIANGYAATSVAAVARAAGVSAPTVFAAFTSKVNLLKEAAETTVVGDAEAVPLAERPEMRRVYEAATEHEVIARLAEFMIEAAPRVYPIMSVVRGAVDADPQIAELAALFDQQSLTGAGYIADAMARHLPDGQHRRRELQDVVWTLISPHLYGQLVVQRGWPAERYGAWIARVLTSSVTLPPLIRPADGDPGPEEAPG